MLLRDFMFAFYVMVWVLKSGAKVRKIVEIRSPEPVKYHFVPHGRLTWGCSGRRLKMGRSDDWTPSTLRLRLVVATSSKGLRDGDGDL